MKYRETERQQSALERVRKSKFEYSKSYRTYDCANLPPEEVEKLRIKWEQRKEQMIQNLERKLANKGARYE